MEKMTIETMSKQYPLFLGGGIIDNLPSILSEVCEDISKVYILSDETVGQLYLDRLVSRLQPDYEVISHLFPSGEKAKSVEMYYRCQTVALENGLDRNSLILALGGGVVGDLAGFVAATFMRGIPFIQIPTTLLAHDSAVGGKVAINHPLGKNMIGAFYQPEAVIYDSHFLRSLPERELRSGFAEVIKHALIHNHSFLTWLMTEIQSIDQLSDEKLQSCIKEGILVKSEIVSIDEQEKGIRAYLNFGHTLGHAIESELGYGEMTHGEAVAIGMIFALKVSEQFYQTNLHSDSFIGWFENLGFQTSIPPSLSQKDLLRKMRSDKKAKAGKIRMVLLKQIGSPEIVEMDDQWLLGQFIN